MGSSNDPLTGGDRASGGLALIIIDMISAWDFPDAQRLLPAALAMAPRIAAFKKRCQRAGVPVIYANDNRGGWRSDFRSVVEASLALGGNRAAVTTALRPTEDDYFILKPRNSGFHATPLALLLWELGIRNLVLAGVASDQCVMATAADARMRDLGVRVPADLVASQSAARNRAALKHFQDVQGISITESPRIRFPGRTRSG